MRGSCRKVRKMAMKRINCAMTMIRCARSAIAVICGIFVQPGDKLSGSRMVCARTREVSSVGAVSTYRQQLRAPL